MKKAFKNHKESNFNSTSTSSPDIIDITTFLVDEAYEKEKLELDKKYLGVHASSASVERMFNISGYILALNVDQWGSDILKISFI